jgi:tellurite methyltransferase
VGVIRTIDGFHRDEVGDWVAELDCLHSQHVRHRPPFQVREWVTTASGRAARIGSRIDCALCDRLELPEGLELARTAGPFDAETIPAGLRRDHLVGDRTWGLLRVLEGAVGFAIETAPPVRVRLVAGEQQPIPPAVRHHLDVGEQVRLVVDFLVKPR